MPKPTNRQNDKTTNRQTVESLSAELAEVQTELADLRSFKDAVVAQSEAYRETQDKLRADAARYRYLRSKTTEPAAFDAQTDFGILAAEADTAVPFAPATDLPEPKQEPEE